MIRQLTQPVDHGLRLEQTVVVGERGERLAVEIDAEVVARRSHQLRVDDEAPTELELEVGVMAAQAERTQQHRRGEPLCADAPRGEPHAQAHGIDAARGAQLDVLRRDPLRRETGAPQGDLVPEKIRQQRRTAGDELRQTAGMGGRDLDEPLGTLAVRQQRRRSAERPRSLAQTLAFGLGGVHDGHIGFGYPQVARCHAVLRSRQRC